MSHTCKHTTTSHKTTGESPFFPPQHAGIDVYNKNGSEKKRADDAGPSVLPSQIECRRACIICTIHNIKDGRNMRAICVTDGAAVLSAHIGKNCRVIAKCVAPFPLLLLLVGLMAVFFRLRWHISHLEYTAEHNTQVCLDSNKLHNNFRSYKDWGDPYQGSFFASFYSTILFLIHRPNKIQKRLHKKKDNLEEAAVIIKTKSIWNTKP